MTVSVLGRHSTDTDERATGYDQRAGEVDIVQLISAQLVEDARHVAEEFPRRSKTVHFIVVQVDLPNQTILLRGRSGTGHGMGLQVAYLEVW